MNNMITEKDVKAHGRTPGGNTSMRTHLHVRRLMYEKGYVEKLTMSISEADLGFPDVKQALDNVLVVLRRLTLTAKELSHHNIIPAASLPDIGDDADLASDSSVSDMHSDREETPDLYRNSTLGMLEPADNEGDEDDDSEEGEGTPPQPPLVTGFRFQHDLY
jgi:E3 ubiquitin-protein ligase HUWE1